LTDVINNTSIILSRRNLRRCEATEFNELSKADEDESTDDVLNSRQFHIMPFVHTFFSVLLITLGCMGGA
jgi:hypothetical protein